jgi:MFS family permease
MLAGYTFHATHTAAPLLRMTLLRVRTFGTSVSGSFITRIGISGAPFLLPLLYQVGLGFTAVQSGLLIMPQAIAAMGSKIFTRRLLESIGYRGVLTANTLILGVLLMLFGTIDTRTPVWLIVVFAMGYGTFSSLQYTSMNTLVFADIKDEDTSSASTIVSTFQHLSISFGVAAAGLTTALFVPDRFRASPTDLIEGTHRAFLALGVFTLLSALVFRSLKANDGANVSQHKAMHAA